MPSRLHTALQALRAQRGFLLFLLCFGVFRTAVADWNPIPSGSMRPTLLEGDVVLVNRLAYDLKLPLTDHVLAHLDDPHRGDVVTFSSPQDGTRLIKRLVALPGDVVELRDGALWLNGQPARYAPPQAVQEPVAPGLEVPALRSTEDSGGHPHPVQWLGLAQAQRSFGPFTVPAGHYFMLGDNRDNSADSRFIGPVPRHLLIGRATRTLASADILGDWMPRLERFGAALP
jgi:signal peptidase I